MHQQQLLRQEFQKIKRLKQNIRTSQDARAYADYMDKVFAPMLKRIQNSNLFDFLNPIIQKKLYLSKNFKSLQQYLLEKTLEIGFLNWEHDDSSLWIKTFSNKHTINNNWLFITNFIVMTHYRPRSVDDLYVPNKYSKQRKIYKLLEYCKNKGLDYIEPDTTEKKLDELIIHFINKQGSKYYFPVINKFNAPTAEINCVFNVLISYALNDYTCHETFVIDKLPPEVYPFLYQSIKSGKFDINTTANDYYTGNQDKDRKKFIDLFLSLYNLYKIEMTTQAEKSMFTLAIATEAARGFTLSFKNSGKIFLLENGFSYTRKYYKGEAGYQIIHLDSTETIHHMKFVLSDRHGPVEVSPLNVFKTVQYLLIKMSKSTLINMYKPCFIFDQMSFLGADDTLLTKLKDSKTTLTSFKILYNYLCPDKYSCHEIKLDYPFKGMYTPSLTDREKWSVLRGDGHYGHVSVDLCKMFDKSYR